MSKRCAKCEKTVYPLEELKCLDKVWHKVCFRCWECNMALNMKTYKGYNKKPYCNAHYPTTAYTAVAETPEMARIAQNTKMQSQIQYHEDFEKSKGKFTVVADDPETLRIKQNTQNISSVAYHDDYEKSRGKYYAIADDMEIVRQRELQNNISMVKYHEDFEKNIKGSKIQVADDPETLRIKASTAAISSFEYKGLRERTNDQESRRSQMAQDSNDVFREEPRRNSDYDPTKVGGIKMAAVAEQPKSSPYSNKNTGFSTVYSSQGKVEQGGNKRVGSIADYDPLNERFGSLTQGYAPASTRSSMSQWEETIPEPQQQNHAPPALPVHEPPPATYHTPPPEPEPVYRPPSPEPPAQQQYEPPPQRYEPPPQRYEPPPQRYEPAEAPVQHYREEGDAIRRQSSVTQEHYPPPQHSMPPQNSMPPPQPAYTQPPPQAQPQAQPQAPAQPPPQPEPAAPPPAQTGNLSGPVYQAVYDYEAQDDDEVGFIEGDLIIDCQPIDDGWMFGTVRRTGKRGMLPANYVERSQ